MNHRLLVLMTTLTVYTISRKVCRAEESILTRFKEFEQRITKLEAKSSGLERILVLQKRQGCQSNRFALLHSEWIVRNVLNKGIYPMSKYFKFSPAFKSTPSVITGLTRYSLSKQADDDLTIRVTELSRTGFRLTINRHPDSKKSPVEVDWMACPR